MSTVTFGVGREASTKLERGLYIPNGNGEPRWVWPAGGKTPAFLAFYQAVTWRQRVFVALIRLVFMLRLQRIVFAAMDLEPGRYPVGNDWALFTGTPGPNRKQVTVLGDGAVTKSTTSETAAANLRNEARFLRSLQRNAEARSYVTPALLNHSNSSLTMERLPHRGTWNTFTDKHAVALGELRRSAPVTVPLGKWPKWETIRSRTEYVRNTQHPEVPTGLLDHLLELVTLEDADSLIHFGPAHGDFTPWNTLRLPGDRLGIIDWELADPQLPAGFDFFHFHLQKGIMVERKNWKEIYTDLLERLTPNVRQELFGESAVAVDDYLRLYLICHVSYYLDLYQRQEEWHEQIYWQLDVWADALAAVRPVPDQRKALITRLFDLLRSPGYAVLKLAHEDPTDLPENSDLDVLVENQQSAAALISRLKDFPHVSRIRTVRKSFMTSLLIVLKDDRILNIDLIWKLKRKAVVFMDVQAVIRRAEVNTRGIRVVSTKDTRRYVQLFYGLNGSAVPTKFQDSLASHAPMDGLYENRGIFRWRNRLDYLMDSTRTMLFNRGFVVTFSGVDGAGKTTVINRVVTMLDKQFRRPVVVLRHRPSVLPILSAYRYGKAEAERKSVASLPRMGNNTSVVSSLARFGYYYLDYLLGQWYVYCRYTLRGYVVVYDRYYYDFMLDGRRSNLDLPDWLTKLGFRFVRTPAFNFFLYADADVILARKQELDRQTIVSLTHSYRSLFKEFGRGRGCNAFRCIENVDLDETLGIIRKAFLQKIKS